MLRKYTQEYYNDLYTQNQQLHYDFRHSYNPAQERFLFVGNIVVMIYAFVYWLFVTREYGKMLYSTMFITSALFTAACLIERKTKIYKDDRLHENFYESFSMICVLAYISWGLMVVWASVKGGHVANYLPVIIVYAICSMFLYFSMHHYIALFLLTLLGSRVVMGICANDYSFDSSIYANIILCGIISTIGGMSKYSVSLKRYTAAVQARKLREALQVNNEELKNTAEKLRKNNEAQRLFTASMSHELRSPLNGVIGMLQVLEDDKTIEGESHENISKALASSKTLISIVNDLLDYYKLEAGEFNIIDGVYDIREIMKINSNIFLSQATEKDLYFKVTARPDMPCIFRGDGVRVQQIIFNIVSNAVKYTQTGGVEISVDYIGNDLTIVVKDTGIGIKKESIDLLFDPFKRVEEHRNNAIQGTGLGLSIVKKLVEQMHGYIKLDSEYGKGSVFIVTIPTEVADDKVRYSDEMAEVVEQDTTVDFSGLSFLCVDDNRVNLTVFKGLFKGTNATITLVDSGVKCLDKIANNKYDIIFLDHMMPGMDGLETFKHMKEDDHLNKETPVVMLTANAGGEAEMMYKEIGFSGYLSKPLLRENLYEITKRMTNR